MSILPQNRHQGPATDAPPPQPITPRITSLTRFMMENRDKPYIHLSPGCGADEAWEYATRRLEQRKAEFSPLLREIEQLNVGGTKSSSTILAATQEKDSGVEQKFCIMFMSPGFGMAHQSVEVTFVGPFPCNPSDMPSACMFGDVEVPIWIKRDGVICCEAPPSCPGIVSVYFTSGDQKACSDVRKFEYVDGFNRCPKCKNRKFKTPQQENEENIELLGHVRMVQMVQPNPPAPAPQGDLIFDVSRIPKGGSSEDNYIRDALEGTGTLPPPLKELLIARLHDWLSEKYPARDDSKEEKRASDSYIEWAARLDRKMMLSVAAHLILNAGDLVGSKT